MAEHHPEERAVAETRKAPRSFASRAAAFIEAVIIGLLGLIGMSGEVAGSGSRPDATLRERLGNVGLIAAIFVGFLIMLGVLLGLGLALGLGR